MDINIVSENNDLEQLLSQHNVLQKDIQFATYSDIYNAKNSSIIILNSYNAKILEFSRLNYAKTIVLCVATDDKRLKSDNVYYLPKPYHIKNLFEILSGFLSEFIKLEQVVDVGKLKFDYIRKLLISDKKQIELTEKESDIIKILLDVYPEALDKKELLNNVWGYDNEIDTHTLETHIYRLRKKVGENSDFIETNKFGYKIKPPE